MKTAIISLLALLVFELIDGLPIGPRKNRLASDRPLSVPTAALITSMANLTNPPTTDCHVHPVCDERGESVCTCAPNLFLIGSKRVASTSFFVDVMKVFPHVDVGGSSPFVRFSMQVFGKKQKSYFDYGYCNDPSDEGNRYMKLWQHGPNQACTQGKGNLRIDFSVTYISDVRVPERIKSFYQHVPIIPSFLVVLREPARRYVSEFKHYKGEGILDGLGIPAHLRPNDLDFDQYARFQLKYFRGCMPDRRNRANDLVSGIKRCAGDRFYIDGLGLGIYVALLDVWTRHFEPKQFIVLSTSSYLKDTALTMRTLATRFGVTPEALALHPELKPTDFERNHVAGESSIKQPDPSVMKEVREFYKPYNQELQSFLQLAQGRGLQVIGSVEGIFDM
jgi:hypothetical protein